jgi:hypothetical protein
MDLAQAEQFVRENTKLPVLAGDKPQGGHLIICLGEDSCWVAVSLSHAETLGGDKDAEQTLRNRLKAAEQSYALRRMAA